MTATQKLNEEILRAAEELAERIEAADQASTAALPMASVTELDVAAEARAENDEIGDLDDTGLLRKFEAI